MVVGVDVRDIGGNDATPMDVELVTASGCLFYYPGKASYGFSIEWIAIGLR